MTAGRRKLTLQEVADRLGVHYMTAYKYVRTGRLRAAKQGVEWRVDPDDLATFRSTTHRPVPRGRARADAWRRLHARLVAGDETGAWSIIDGVLASGAQPAEIHLEVIVPAMRLVGDRWASGDLTVADEHRAAAVAQRLVGRLGPRFVRRGRKRGTVIVGGPSDELHALPISIVADLLRHAGFDVVDLGPNTPAQSFVDAAAGTERLVTVAIGVTTPEQDDALAETIQALTDAGIGVPVLVGGAALIDEGHARRLGADGFTGHRASDAIRTIESVASGFDAGSDAAS